jgi:hypothetical protein
MFTGRNERRASCRYPVKAEIFYFHHSGQPDPGRGVLVNVCSGGVLFESNGEFRPGMRLKLEILWPAPSRHTSPLVVKISGRVVRVEGEMTAIGIETSEFQPLARKIAET